MRDDISHDFACAVAKVLGSKWSAKEENYWRQILEGPASASLCMTGSPSRRIRISGYPKHHHGDGFAITVSGDSSAERAAAEIKRRLLPRYLPALERSNNLEKSIIAAKAKTAKYIAALKKKYPKLYVNTDSGVSWYTTTVGSGTLTLYGDRVNLTCTIPAEDAKRILAAILKNVQLQG